LLTPPSVDLLHQGADPAIDPVEVGFRCDPVLLGAIGQRVLAARLRAVELLRQQRQRHRDPPGGNRRRHGQAQ